MRSIFVVLFFAFCSFFVTNASAFVQDGPQEVPSAQEEVDNTELEEIQGVEVVPSEKPVQKAETAGLEEVEGIQVKSGEEYGKFFQPPPVDPFAYSSGSYSTMPGLQSTLPPGLQPSWCKAPKWYSEEFGAPRNPRWKSYDFGFKHARPNGYAHLWYHSARARSLQLLMVKRENDLLVLKIKLLEATLQQSSSKQPLPSGSKENK